MNISELLKEEYILDDLKSKTKREVLVELSQVFLGKSRDIDADTIVEVLLDREKLGSTGIGEGIAIPHGKLPGLDSLILSFGRSRSGVDFDALDGRPVHIFFLLMAPENSAGQHLKALAKISRMLKDKSFREDLMAVEKISDVYSLIQKKDAMFP